MTEETKFATLEAGVAFQARSAQELTADIVSAYVSHNAVQIADLPALIRSVSSALEGVYPSGIQANPVAPAEPLTPAEVRKSIKPSGLTSFIDGKSYKILKRHLTKHGLDGAVYRARYGLPHDYPMVCADYSAQRADLARKLGLGHSRSKKAA